MVIDALVQELSCRLEVLLWFSQRTFSIGLSCDNYVLHFSMKPYSYFLPFTILFIVRVVVQSFKSVDKKWRFVKIQNEIVVFLNLISVSSQKILHRDTKILPRPGFTAHEDAVLHQRPGCRIVISTQVSSLYNMNIAISLSLPQLYI